MVAPLIEEFALGLDAPICLTWELTYACNLACVQCLSSSGRRDPTELSTAECKAVIDTLQRMQVFYVNIGGGEPGGGAAPAAGPGGGGGGGGGAGGVGASCGGWGGQGEPGVSVAGFIP